MERKALEASARQILQTNLRRGVADWNGKEFSFVVPSLRGYPFQWFWDSCFHAIALTHLDLDQAKAELTTLMSAALPDGFIPHIIFWEMEKQPEFLARNIVGMVSPNYSSTIQPPILAYAVERVYEATGDQNFKNNSLPILMAYYRWLRANRDPDEDGLISVIQPEEAGTDCSPKYDEVLGIEDLSNQGFIAALKKVYEVYEPLRGDDKKILETNVFHVEDVLVNSIYSFSLRALARMLGDSPDAAEFNKEADKTRDALVSKCWDETTSAFYDLSGTDESMLKTVTISSLMPLILADLPSQIVDMIVEKWILSEEEFWLPYPLPSVPASSSKFISGNPGGFIWRGPTWINTNWFLSHALRRHGYKEVAEAIVEKSYEAIELSGYREYYNPYTAEGLGARDFGWSTLILDF